MKGRFLIVICFLGLLSCEPPLEKIETPDNLIEKQKFTNVLREVMLVEAHLQNKYNSVNKYYNIMQNSVKEIFVKYDVDSLSYANSMDYYAQKQEVLREIYTEVQDTINVQKIQIENQ